MGLTEWLRRADLRNQRVVDAISNRVDVTGTGVVIESLPGDGNSDAAAHPTYLRVDGGPKKALLWGTTFHPLPPGPHRLVFGRRFWWGLPGRKHEVTMEIPAEGQVRIRYRQGWWSTRGSSVEVLGD